MNEEWTKQQQQQQSTKLDRSTLFLALQVVSLQSQFSVRVRRYVSWKLADNSFRLLFFSVLSILIVFSFFRLFHIPYVESRTITAEYWHPYQKSRLCTVTGIWFCSFVHSFCLSKSNTKIVSQTAICIRIQSEKDE